jgi:hypothetical protein
MKLVRYADDFVVLLTGTRDDAEALWDEVGAVLAPMGLRLSEEETRVCHVDEGFDFWAGTSSAGPGEDEPESALGGRVLGVGAGRGAVARSVSPRHRARRANNALPVASSRATSSGMN